MTTEKMTSCQHYRPGAPVLLLVGLYGSGKSELAISLAVSLATEGERVHLVDLDMVNPYFRCREAREYLAAHGVDLT